MERLTEVLYRVMVGLAGFSIGLALTLTYQNVKAALKGDVEQWLWAGARLGYAMIIIVLMPLIFLARSANAPFNWQSWVFMLALILEAISFSGILLMRHRGTKTENP